ncbi:MAG TPA: hypothetical protein VL727_04500 [Puia sp.]|nr:hypothetical protein [Puia sp.]
MKRDDLYETIRPLFEQGLIRRFRDIFQYVAESTFAADLGKKTERFKELIEQVDQFTVEEIVLMGSLVNLSLGEMISLIIADYPTVVTQPSDEKNSLYKAVRAMYDQGKVQSFSEIFKYIRVSIVAKDIKKNRSRLAESIRSGIKKFPLKTLVAIGNLCYLALTDTLKLVEAEYIKQTQKKSLSSE